MLFGYFLSPLLGSTKIYVRKLRISNDGKVKWTTIIRGVNKFLPAAGRRGELKEDV